MIDGVRVEDWNFIFESENPNCEVKFNNIIDKYFENAKDELFKKNGIVGGMVELPKLDSLKTYVRRKDISDATWVIEIPPPGGYKPVYPSSKMGKKDKIINQYERFTDMLNTIRYNK